MTKSPEGGAKSYEELFPGLDSPWRNWQHVTCWILELLWTSDSCLSLQFPGLQLKKKLQRIRPEELHLHLDLIYMKMSWISSWNCNRMKLFRSFWKCNLHVGEYLKVAQIVQIIGGLKVDRGRQPPRWSLMIFTCLYSLCNLLVGKESLWKSFSNWIGLASNKLIISEMMECDFWGYVWKTLEPPSCSL